MTKKLIAFFSLLVLLLGTPSPAHASPVTGDGQSADLTLLDPQARGEITIIRTGNNPYDDAAAALTCGSAPSGRQVRLRYVSGINLATDWGRLGGLTVEWAAQHISHEWIEVTDSAGRATFADLPVGLYLVDELAGDESAVGDPEKENSGCRRIAPFLVTLPVTEKGTWSYRLEITPKMINPAGPHPEPSPTAAPPTQPARPTPPTPSEPTAPPAEPQPSDQPQRTGWGFLTETGAAVEMLLLVSGALLGCGVVATRRQRRERTGHTGVPAESRLWATFRALRILGLRWRGCYGSRIPVGYPPNPRCLG